MKKKLIYSVSGIALVTVAIGGTVFAAQLNDKSEEQPVGLPHVSYESPTTTAQNEPAAVVATQATIQEKMLNSVDYFKSVQATYRTVLKPIGVDETMNLQIVEGANASSYVKITDNKTNAVQENSFNGAIITTKDAKGKNSKNVAGTNVGKPKGERKTKTAKGEAVFINRIDPSFSGPAQDVILPQSYAFWLNDDTKNYKIEGEESFLGRTATVISGTHDKDMAIKHDATHFTLWVDSETGVLLKLSETNDKGEETNRIEATTIEFNNSSIKAKDLSATN
ncbi:Tfp pilus assembly protein PilE [Paenibacillus rhizosphaerae]|uniref:Tfp pilus assembly protein PilE n=1 Tax=Paenibacillus rhizosphaerae TaxID=297318 RepID=A0A839TJT5_9BACL|nr:hypothetical protein [Paenibacillus rhizosphaerae]MBB3127065.1 Tfp pilus assembly protein PilE [Paenibacillus rhizosphaerae]